MGTCHSQSIRVLPELDTADQSPSIEQQLHTAIAEFRTLHRQIRHENPFLLSLAFIHELNAKRASIQALLMRMEVDEKPRYSTYESYFVKRDTALKMEMYELFRTGRMRVAAETARIPGVLDMLMPKEKGGSALF
jgi:hypothetical protein